MPDITITIDDRQVIAALHRIARKGMFRTGVVMNRSGPSASMSNSQNTSIITIPSTISCNAPLHLGGNSPLKHKSRPFYTSSREKELPANGFHYNRLRNPSTHRVLLLCDGRKRSWVCLTMRERLSGSLQAGKGDFMDAIKCSPRVLVAAAITAPPN